MASGATVSVSVVSNVAGATRGINAVASSVSNLQSTAGRASSRMRAAFAGMVGGATFAVVNKGIGLVTGSIGDAVRRVDTLSNANKVFAAMGFSAKDTSAVMKALNSDISGLPTSMDQAVGGVQQLAAASGNLKEGEKIYAALNDAVLGFGGSTADVNSTIVQFGQAVSAGKLDAATWNSLVQTMGPALRAMANDMGMSTAQLKAGLSAGTISIGQFNQELIKMNTKGGGGMKSFQSLVKAATGGIGTSFANMRTSVVRGLANILMAIGPQRIAGAVKGIGTVFEKGLGALVPVVAKIAGTVAPVVAKIGPALSAAFASKGTQKGIAFLRDALASFGQNVASAIKALGPALAHLVAALAPMAKGALAVGVGAVGGAFKLLGPLLAGAAKAASAFLKAMPASVIQMLAAAVVGYVAAVKTMAVVRAMTTAVRGLNLAMTANPIGLVVAAIAALVVGLVLAYKHCATFRAIVQTAFAVVITTARTLATFFVKTVPAAFAAVVRAGRGMVSWVVGLPGMFVKALGVLRTVVIGAFSGAWQRAMAWQVNIIKSMIKWVTSIPGNFRKGLSRLTSTLGGIFSGAMTRAKSWVSGGITTMVNWIGGIPTRFTNQLGRLGSTVGSLFRNGMDAGKTAVKNAIDAIVGYIGSIPGKFTSKLKDITSAAKDVGGDIVTGIKNGLGGVINAIGGIGSAISSAVKGAVNAALHLPLVLPSFKIPHTPIHFGGKTLIPKLLAEGGITTGPTLAIIGDNPSGREAVVPLEKAGQMGFGGSGPVVVEVYLDGQIVDRKIARAMNGQARRVVLRGVGA